MTSVSWDPKVRKFLRKLPKSTATRIFHKVDEKVKDNVLHYLENLVDKPGYKIRIGNYRLFVDYDNKEVFLTIRAIRHRKNAYKT